MTKAETNSTRIRHSDFFQSIEAVKRYFCFQIIAELLDCLVMRAVHFGKTVRRSRVMTQRLNVALFLVGKVMIRDVELQCAAKRDVKYLKPFTDCQNRHSARQRFLHRLKFPTVALWIDVFVDHTRVRNFLSQELRGNIGTACEQKAIHLVERNSSGSCIEDFDFRVPGEQRAKPLAVLRPDPGSQIGHRRICDLRVGM